MRSRDILEKITKYRMEREWSEYLLAEKSGLPQSTISSWYRKNQLPTITSLEKICDAFNVTLAQFFTDDIEDTIQLTENQKSLLNEWNTLTKEQQNALLSLIKTM